MDDGVKTFSATVQLSASPSEKQGPNRLSGPTLVLPWTNALSNQISSHSVVARALHWFSQVLLKLWQKAALIPASPFPVATALSATSRPSGTGFVQQCSGLLDRRPRSRGSLYPFSAGPRHFNASRKPSGTSSQVNCSPAR